MSSDSVELFTDGACKGNPGPGGWGALLVCKGVEKELWGGEANTTNNRMELMGAIRGLEELKRSCDVLLVTDSQYVMKGINEWMDNWNCLLYTSPSPRDQRGSRMPSSA